MRKLPTPRIPDKRLIVYSGLANKKGPMEALLARRVDSIMASFIYVRQGKWWANKYRPKFDEYPQWRFLDSGVFTFKKKYGLWRGSAFTPKVKIRAGGKVSQSSSSHGAREREVNTNVTYDPDDLAADIKKHFNDYVAYLKAGGMDDWDFIVEMDVDEFTFGDTSGVEVARACRKILKALVGDKLMPVWHYEAGEAALIETAREFPYVAIGSGGRPDSREIRYLCDAVHLQGAKVHGLGTSRADVLAVTPFDSVDSSTWLSGVRYGMYAGWRITSKESMANNPRAHARAARFRTIVENLGYDPEDLLSSSATLQSKFEVALALFQQRQDDAPPIPPAGRELRTAPLM